MNTPKPVAIIAAARTPYRRAFTDLADRSAVDLGVHAVRHVLGRSGLTTDDVDEVIFGNVAGPPDAANVARVISLAAGIPHDRIAHTVNRNCGSGMESLIAAWQSIGSGRGKTIVAGGSESMSNIPLLYRTSAVKLFTRLAKSRTMGARIGTLAHFRPRHFKPVAGIELGLTDPVSGLNMGQTAEVLAEQFDVSRTEQDEYALESHRRADAARRRCFLSGEIAAMETSTTTIDHDNGIRENQSMETLGKLRPIFDPAGTVTAGNACQITDGAAAVVMAAADDVARFDRKPLGYVTGYAIAGCDPRRMGLGPVYATAKLLRETARTLDDFDRIELNEAFAAQVIACQRAAESATFAREELGLSKPLGKFDSERLNIHGGAIALGHPVGSTGTRIVITLLRALRQAGLRRGLATLCIGGGQGMALSLETELE